MKKLFPRHPRSAALAGITAAVFCALLVGLAATASAQSLGKVKIDFPFVAGKAQLSPGAYDVEVADGRVTLRPTDPKGQGVMLPVITRLGRHDTDTESEFVFDKVAGTFVLSEIWLGSADGYLVAITARDHEHRVLGGSNPHK